MLFVSMFLLGSDKQTWRALCKNLEENGALEYTIVVSADSSEAVLNQYLAPYSAAPSLNILGSTKRCVDYL